MKKRKLSVLAGAVALAFAASSAQAMLVEATPFKVDMSGTGLGNVDTILTIQSPGSIDTETGSVFAVGAGENISGDTQAINQLRSFAGPASNLRIVFNPSEPQNDQDGITLQNLILTAFDASGTKQFTSGPSFMPVTLTATDAGTGNSGFVFKLDDMQAAKLDSAISGFGATRIGLSATANGATGGHETFFLMAVPEPSTWAMLVAGVIGVAGMVRRRVS